MLRAACKSFPTENGLGVDAVQPRALLRLSDQALHALFAIMMAAKLHGQWPELIRTVLIVLIPKDDGGRRTIGMLPILFLGLEQSARTHRALVEGVAGQALPVWRQGQRSAACRVDAGRKG